MGATAGVADYERKRAQHRLVGEACGEWGELSDDARAADIGIGQKMRRARGFLSFACGI